MPTVPSSVLRRALPLALVLALVLPAHAARQNKFERSLHDYVAPDVELVDQFGAPVRLRDLIEAGRPVLVDFIYATCTTICPVLSAGLASFQRKLGPDAAEQATLISFTIDPDHDTPALMHEYAERYRARPGWHFLTGSHDDIEAVMRAFDAYVDNKMNHYPVTFMRAPGSSTWVRLYGLMGTRDLLKQYAELPGGS